MDSIIAIAANRRNNRRHNVFKDGEIIFTASDQTIPVSIRNMSASGAGLRINHVDLVPAEFDLFLLAESLLVRVSLRWRHGEFCGVKFVGEPRHVT